MASTGRGPSVRIRGGVGQRPWGDFHAFGVMGMSLARDGDIVDSIRSPSSVYVRGADTPNSHLRQFRAKMMRQLIPANS